MWASTAQIRLSWFGNTNLSISIVLYTYYIADTWNFLTYVTLSLNNQNVTIYNINYLSNVTANKTENLSTVTSEKSDSL